MANHPSSPGLFSAQTLQKARELYPLTGTGMIYLNHAGTSPLSSRVVKAMTDYLRDRSSGRIDTYRTDVAMVSETKSLVASLIHAESPDRIALCPSTTDAINIIASGVQWKTGDRILLNSAEFPANVWPFLNARKAGVNVDTLACTDGKVTPAMIEQAIQPRTRLIGLSAVQFLSGYRADLQAIGEMCRKRGIVFAVDGIQAVGATRVDVRAMKIDALSVGGQKWLMSPHGSGFLYITEALQDQIQQSHVGWLAVKDPWEFYNFEQPLAATARRYEGGSLAMPSLWGMHAALKILLEFGPEEIEAHILDLTGILIEKLSTIDRTRILTPTEPDRRAGIVTIEPTGGLDPGGIASSLVERNIIIAVREGKIRLSPHFYNSAEEMERTASAVASTISKMRD